MARRRDRHKRRGSPRSGGRASSGASDRRTPEREEPLYGLTDRGREFAFIHICAMHVERKLHIPAELRPSNEAYLSGLVTDLVVIMPLVEVPPGTEGVCDLVVTNQGVQWGGLNVTYRGGEMLSHAQGFSLGPRARIIGDFDAWGDALTGKDMGGMGVRGDHSFGSGLLDAMVARSIIPSGDYRSD